MNDASILGFDYGEKRIGVSVGQSITHANTIMLSNATEPQIRADIYFIRIQLVSYYPQCSLAMYYSSHWRIKPILESRCKN